MIKIKKSIKANLIALFIAIIILGAAIVISNFHYRNRINTLESKTENLSIEHQIVCSEKEALLENLKQTSKKLLSIKDNLNRERLNTNNVKSVIKEIRENYSRLRSTYTDTIDDYKKLAEEFSKLNSEKQKIESKYSEILENQNKLMDNYYYIKENYSSTLHYYTKLKENYDSIYSDYRIVKKEKSNLENKNANLKENFNRLSSEHENLQDKHNLLLSVHEETLENLQTIESELKILRQGNKYNLHDPTHFELKTFLKNDRTDENAYDIDGYTCFDYSKDVIKSAMEKGIMVGLVRLEVEEEPSPDINRPRYWDNRGAHALVVFNTLDNGRIYVEPQDDTTAKYLGIGQSYQDSLYGQDTGYPKWWIQDIDIIW